MDFLFLNESTSVDNGEMEAWLESTYGVSGQTDKNQSLGDFQLEFQEAMHEAEIQSMKDEFRLYQEEASGILHEEGVIDTLKNWWRKIVEWVTKAWNKILHWIEVGYAFIRKKVQEWYMKLRDRKIVYVRKGLKGSSDACLAAIKTGWQSQITAITSLSATVAGMAKGDTEGDMKDTALEAIKDAYEKFKDQIDEQKDKFNDNDTSKAYEPMPINEWKKLVDDCVKTVDKCRAEKLKTKQAIFKRIKDVDNQIKDAYNKFKATKEGTPDRSTKAASLRAVTRYGNILKAVSGYEMKFVNAEVSLAKWVLSKAINTARSKEKED